MIISNGVKKNIKVAIFSSSNSILDVVKNEIENIGYKVVEYTQIDTLKSIVEEFSKETETFEIALVSAGSFMTSENVLFYSPTMTEDLSKCNKYYTRNNWFPHCTLAIRLSDEELEKGLKLLKENNILPLRVRCEKVDILDYSNKPDYNQIAIFDLN